jgi:hypothetical protein
MKQLFATLASIFIIVAFTFKVYLLFGMAFLFFCIFLDELNQEKKS